MRPRSILIVDDDEEICDFLVFEFTRRGWRALFALDGEAAWARVANEPVDVIISDVKMPELDGLELLARVRGLDERPAFVLMSGYSAVERSDPRALDADEIVTKPFDVEELVRLVDHCVSARSSPGGSE